MNTKGDIRELKPGEELKDNEVPVGKQPRPDCKDCWGRGQITYVLENKREIKPCHCVSRQGRR